MGETKEWLRDNVQDAMCGINSNDFRTDRASRNVIEDLLKFVMNEVTDDDIERWYGVDFSIDEDEFDEDESPDEFDEVDEFEDEWGDYVEHLNGWDDPEATIKVKCGEPYLHEVWGEFIWLRPSDIDYQGLDLNDYDVEAHRWDSK